MVSLHHGLTSFHDVLPTSDLQRLTSDVVATLFDSLTPTSEISWKNGQFAPWSDVINYYGWSFVNMWLIFYQHIYVISFWGNQKRLPLEQSCVFVNMSYWRILFTFDPLFMMITYSRINLSPNKGCYCVKSLDLIIILFYGQFIVITNMVIIYILNFQYNIDWKATRFVFN